jgi:IclR family acetate operon transcriptional repressor
VTFKIQSVTRALDLLEIVAKRTEAIGIVELAKEAGLHVSTCHHLAKTLVGRGYLSQPNNYSSYSIGNKAIALAQVATAERPQG